MKFKQGDEVFVVDQRCRGRKEDVTRTASVVRVGRKFGYVMRYGFEVPFDLETGQSHHKEWNERANGNGFDVYINREEWEQKCHSQEEYARLCRRLAGSSGYAIVTLTPQQVVDIHAVLDREVEKC